MTIPDLGLRKIVIRYHASHDGEHFARFLSVSFLFVSACSVHGVSIGARVEPYGRTGGPFFKMRQRFLIKLIYIKRKYASRGGNTLLGFATRFFVKKLEGVLC